MKTVKIKGKIRNFWKQKIDPVLSYATESRAFENIDEVRAAGAYPKDATIVKFLNAKEKAKAKQAEMVATVEGAGYVKPTAANDPQIALRDMVRTLMAGGRKTLEEARAAASVALGIEWEDDEDEDNDE